MSKSLVAAVVLNWNDASLLKHSVGSLLNQTMVPDVIVVDNGSEDESREVIEDYGDKITPLWNSSNLGFAGGVNTGIKHAIDLGYEYIALLNNDAVADKNWIEILEQNISKNSRIGAVTSSIIKYRTDEYDSTGEQFTIWGLAYPRGRGEKAEGQYGGDLDVMGASGGASMFRASMFKDIGLFDEDFFAYYEDIDIGLRAHTRGWKFKFVPDAKVLHATGTTSGRVKNFGTYQGLKNQPLVLIKNVPLSILWRMAPRFILAHTLFNLRALSRGQFTTVFKTWLVLLWLIPKKLVQRIGIQHRRVPTATKDINELIVLDLPHNATALRKFRSLIRKVFPKFV
ncbi:glycosyltransferase family 2 protein [Candidatus Nomurabacteria bacterium]|nr:glycosyltransferase family 2 protein [Candidatus Nomurabacteria bacterium]